MWYLDHLSSDDQEYRSILGMVARVLNESSTANTARSIRMARREYQNGDFPINEGFIAYKQFWFGDRAVDDMQFINKNVSLTAHGDHATRDRILTIYNVLITIVLAREVSEDDYALWVTWQSEIFTKAKSLQYVPLNVELFLSGGISFAKANLGGAHIYAPSTNNFYRTLNSPLKHITTKPEPEHGGSLVSNKPEKSTIPVAQAFEDLQEVEINIAHSWPWKWHDGAVTDEEKEDYSVLRGAGILFEADREAYWIA
jgi:hypothetical protein